MYYYILLTLLLAILLIAVLLTLSYYRPELLAHLWNKVISNTCEAQDANFVNGIPSYCKVEDRDAFNVKLLDQLLQLNADKILSEISAVIKDNREDVISIDSELPTLKSITDNISGLVSSRVIICQPGVTITNNNGPFRFLQRYCYTLQVPPNDVGLNLGGYNVMWEPRTSMLWDSTIKQTIWNHTKLPNVVIIIDLYRSLSLFEHMGSKLVRYLCSSLLLSHSTTSGTYKPIQHKIMPR